MARVRERKERWNSIAAPNQDQRPSRPESAFVMLVGQVPAQTIGKIVAPELAHGSDGASAESVIRILDAGFQGPSRIPAVDRICTHADPTVQRRSRANQPLQPGRDSFVRKPTQRGNQSGPRYWCGAARVDRVAHSLALPRTERQDAQREDFTGPPLLEIDLTPFPSEHSRSAQARKVSFDSTIECHEILQ